MNWGRKLLSILLLVSLLTGSSVFAYADGGTSTLPAGSAAIASTAGASLLDTLFPYVKSVAAIADKTVANGTAKSAIGLPGTVVATLSNGKTKTLSVTWNNGSPTYNAAVAGAYTFTGSLRMTTGIYNFYSVKASAKVTVQAKALPAVTALSSFTDVIVSYGTDLAGGTMLPTAVTATIADGTSASLAVVWDLSAWKTTSSGKFVFSGTPTLTSAISNPNALKASITVYVLPAPSTSTFSPNLDPNPSTPLSVSAGTAVIPFDEASEFEPSSSASIDEDKSNRMQGAASLKISTTSPIEIAGAGTAYSSVITAGSIGGAMADMDNLEMNIYVPEKGKLQYILVKAYTDDSRNAFFQNGIGDWELTTGWNRIRRTKADFGYLNTVPTLIQTTTDGAIEVPNILPSTWNSISKIELYFVFKTGVSMDINLDSFSINTRGRTKILFTFDDAWSSVYSNAMPILDAKGWKATTWANMEAAQDIYGVYNGAFMSEETLDKLYQNGWDIGNHTLNHPDNESLLTDVEIAGEYLYNQNWLLGKGWTRGAFHVCYPSGSYSDRLASILQTLGVKSARTTAYGMEPAPLTNVYKLKCAAIGRDTNIQTYVKEEIDRAVATGSSLMFMLHRVEDSPEPDDGVENYGQIAVSTENFRDIVEYVSKYVDANQADVVTVSQWYDAYMGK